MSQLPPVEDVRSLLQTRAAALGERPWLIAPDEEVIDFASLLADAQRLAAHFHTLGLRPGDRVAWLLPNGSVAVRLFVAAMAAGLVAMPLSPLAQPAQLAYVLEHGEPKLVFVGPAQAVALAEALGERRSAVIVEAVTPDWQVPGDLSGASPDAFTLPPPGPDHPALLMYTSGTTGRPKGVLLSHANLLAGARFVSEAHVLTADDRVLAVLPLYHINAQVVTVLAPLWHGGSLVMPARFGVGAFWRLAETWRCTWLNLVPTMIAYLLSADTNPTVDAPRARFCRSASAPLPAQQLLDFEARFGLPVIETMGLTETAAPVFANPHSGRKPGSPGRAWGCEARTVDVVSGQILGPGESGEIQIRGPNVMAGYFRAPAETLAAFSADGWLRTGDLGHCDADGFWFVTGRLKELIIKGGENIAPREIDEVLLQHPAILEAAAAGVPDPMYGQDIVAGIVLREACTVDDAELQNFCHARLGPFKTPRRFIRLDALPKGPSGKVQRLRIAG